MSVSIWRKLLQEVRRPRRLPSRRYMLSGQKRSASSLWLEQLEDRTLLSTFQWTGASLLGTNWGDAANWSLVSGSLGAGFPNAAGDIAQFTGTIAGAASVTLNQAITVGEIDFGTASSISINAGGGSVLTLNNAGFSSNSIISLLPANNGADTIFAPIAASTPLAANLAGGQLVLNNSGATNNSIGSGSTFTINNGAMLSVQGPRNTGSANVIVNFGGTLLVSGSGTLAGAATVTLNTDGSFRADDNVAGLTPNRLGSGSNVTNLVLNGGTFEYVGANNTPSNLPLGTVTLSGGQSGIIVSPTGTGSAVLTAAALIRQAGATVNFSGNGTPLDTASAQIAFAVPPTTVGDNGGILPFATVSGGPDGTDFATYDPTGNSIAAFTGYVSSIAAAGPGDTVRETTTEVLTSNVTINALLLTGSAIVGEAGNTLTLASGGLLNLSTAQTNNIIGGTLAFGAGGTGEAIVMGTTVGAAGGAAILGVETAFYNESSLSNPAPIGFASINFSAAPTATRIDPSINYPDTPLKLAGSGAPGPAVALPTGVQVATVAAQFTGYLNVVTGGTYTFNTVASDGFRILIDGSMVVFGNNQVALGGTGGTATLTPGWHSFVEQYYHLAADGACVTTYSGPDTGGVTVILGGPSTIGSPGLYTTPGQYTKTTINSLIVAASLTVGGGGTLVLPLANNITGTVNVADGVVTVANNNALGTGTLNLVTGALVSIVGVTLANPFTLSNSVITLGSLTATTSGTATSSNLALSGPGTISGANTLTVINAALTTLSGAIGGSGSLTISSGPGNVLNVVALPAVLPTASGLLIIGGANTYTGGTVVAGNVIVASNSPFGTGSLTVTGGTLFADASARTIANPTVLGGNFTIAASSTGGTSSANSSLNLAGSINVLGNCTINLNGTATFSGNLSGAGQLTVQSQNTFFGPGSLTLAGANNSSFSGGVVLNDGSLGALGTLSITNSSALGSGPLTLTNGTLQAANAGITLANQLFLNGGYVSFSGSPFALTNALATDAAVGTTNLIVNTNTTIGDALGGSGSLVLYSGTGTLTMTGSSSYTGSTIVNGGTLTLGGPNGALAFTTGLTVNVGGTINLDNTGSAASNNINRVSDAAAVILNGGTFNFIGNGSAASSESIGSLTVASGNSTVSSTAGTGSGASSLLSLGSYFRDPGATVDFVGGSTNQLQQLGTAANQIQLGFVNLPPGGILPGATVTDATNVANNPTHFNLATYGGLGVTALTSYQTLSAAGGNLATDNVLVTANTTLTASDQVSAMLVIGTNTTVAGSAGTALTVNNGMVATSGTGIQISVPTLVFPATTTPAVEAIVFTGAGSDTLSGAIAGSGGLTIGGAGNLTLPTANSYSNVNAVAEVQQLVLSSNVTGGTITLSFNGATTASIAFTTLGTGPSPAQLLQNALQLLPTVGPNNVLVTGPSAGPFTITFAGALAGADQPSVVVASSTLGTSSGTGTITANTLENGGATTYLNSGTLTLGTNSAIVGGLSLVGGTIVANGAVTFPTGVDLGNNASGGSSNVTFAGSNPINISGGVTMNGLSDVLNVSNSVSAVQTISFGGTGLGGTFTMTFNGVSTGPIAYNGAAATLQSSIQSALDGLSNLGAGNTVVTATSATSFTVTFQNRYGAVNVPLLTAASSLTGTNASVAVANTTPGGGGGLIISGSITSNPLQGNNPGTNVPGSPALVKQGTGTMILTGSNTYSGETIVSSGIVNLQNSNALGAVGNAVQTITFGGTITNSSAFTLSFNGLTSSVISYSTTASALGTNIQYALNNLANIGLGNAIVSATSATTVTVAFQNLLGSQNVPLLTATSFLQGTSPTITIATTTPGFNGSTVVNSGATVQFQFGSGTTASVTGITVPEEFTLSGAGVGGIGALDNINANNRVTGSVNLYASASIGGDNYQLTFGNSATNSPGGSPITGGADLTKVGGGTIEFNVSNGSFSDSSFTGELTVQSGVLMAQPINSTVLGAFSTAPTSTFGSSAGGIQVLSGATLELPAGANGNVAGKPLILNGAGLGTEQPSNELNSTGALLAASQVVWSGSIILATNTITSDSSVFTVTGVVSGPGNWTDVGSTNLVLQDAETFTGTFTKVTGIVILNSAGSFTQAMSATNAQQTITFGGTINSGTGSTFTLAFNNATTTPIAYSSSTAALQSNIQNALNALPTIGAGNAAALVSGSTATVTFQNGLGGAVLPTLTASSSLTGTNPTVTVATTINGVAPITLDVSATLELDNLSSFFLPNRIADNDSITFNGANFTVLPNSTPGVPTTETLGTITLASGNSTFILQGNAVSGDTTVLTSAGLNRLPGSAVKFQGTVIGLGATNQFLFQAPPILTNGILPYAVVSTPSLGGSITTSAVLDFATYGPIGIVAYSGYVTSLASATATSNVRLTVGTSLSTNKVVNSLLLVGAVNLTISGGGNNYTLTVASGAVMSISPSTATIAGGTLDFGPVEGMVLGNSNLTITSVISGSAGVTDASTATVTLGAIGGTGNTYTGTTTLDAGTLQVATVSSLSSGPVNLTSGTLGTASGVANTFGIANALNFNNSVVSLGANNNSVTFAGPVTLTGTNFISGGLSAAATLAGVVSGTGMLVVENASSSGQIVLTNSGNTYSGGTAIGVTSTNGTQLLIENSSVVSGGVLVSGPLGIGPFIPNGNGGPNSSGVTNYCGFGVTNTATTSFIDAVPTVTLNNQMILVNAAVRANGANLNGGGNIVWAGPVSVTGLNSLQVAGSINVQFTGVVSGSGGILYTGGGTATSQATFTGNNTFTGGLSFASLTGSNSLVIGNSSALGAGPFSLAGGVVEDDGKGGAGGYVINNPVEFDSGNGAGNAHYIAVIGSQLTFTGLVTGAGFYTKVGPGNLALTNIDVHTGTTEIGQGTLTFSGGGSLLLTSSLTIDTGATLTLDNTAVNNSNRIGDGIPISLIGGTINFLSNSSTVSTETLGAVTLGTGGSTISSTGILTIAALTHNAGALVNFSGPSLGSAGNQIIVDSPTTAPTLVTNGYVLPYATVTGAPGTLDVASVPSLSGPFPITAFTGYVTGGLSASTSALDVVKLAPTDPPGSDNVSQIATVAGIVISGDGVTVNGPGSLALGDGILLSTGANAAGDTITVPVLLGTQEGLFVSSSSTPAGGGLTLANTISGSSGLTVGGTGTVNLTGANTFSSGLTQASNTGTLVFNNNIAGSDSSNTLTLTGGTIQAGPSGGAAGITLANPVNLALALANTTSNNFNFLTNINNGIGVGSGIAVNFGGANPLTLNGAISGTGGITVNGGLLNFNGTAANLYTGTTTVTAGTLSLGKTTTASPANITGIGGPILVNGPGVLQETTNANQVQLNVGTTASPDPLTISSGGTFNLGPNQATVNNVLFNNGGSVTMTAGGVFTVANNVATTSTGGLASMATISGGNLVLSNTTFANFNIASSGGTLSGPVQTLSFGGLTSGGNFTLSINNQTTAPINFSTVASTLAANVQSALTALSTVGSGGATVVVSGTATQPTVTVTFPNVVAGTSLPTMTVSSAAINAVQTITFPGNPASGTFTLNFNSQTTAPIAYNANPLTLQTNIQNALNALQSLGATNDQQTINFSNSALTGTFTLAFNGQTTGPIAYSSAASTLQANVQNALSALSTINSIGGIATNSVNLAVSGTNTAAIVTFQNALGGTAQNLLTFNGAGLTGGTISSIAHTTTGAASTSNLTKVSSASATSVNVTFQNADGGGVALPTIGGGGVATSSQQQIVFPSTVTTGTFELTFNGQTTAPINYSTLASALASNIQGALAALSTIGSANVAVSVSGLPQVATVTFLGGLGGVLQPPLGALGAGNAVQTISFPGNPANGTFTLSFGAATTAPIAYSTTTATLQTNIQNALGALSTLGATNDVQTINFTGTPAGTFTLTFNGQTTGPITYSSAVATLQANVQNALNALPTISAVGGLATNSANVAVIATSSTVAVTFQNALGGVPQTLAANGAGLTAGAISGVTHTTTGAPAAGNVVVTATSATSVNITFQGSFAGSSQAVLGTSGLASNNQQQVSFAGVTGGTFKLTLGSQTTAPISYSSTATTLASAIETALAALAGVGGTANVAVSVTGSPQVATALFQGALSGTPLPTMSVTATPLVNALQTIGFPGNPTGGVFTLSFNGSTTASINYSTSATALQTNIQNALNTTLGAGNTTVTAVSATNVSVNFLGALAGGNESAAGTGTGAGTPAVNDVQTLAFPNPTSGSFTIIFSGQTTTPIVYSTNLATLQANIIAALGALSTINGTNNINVQVTTATGANNSVTVTATITFQNALGGAAQPQMTGNGTTANAVQTIAFSGGPTGGTFTLTVGNGTTSQTTAPINYSSNPGTLQANMQNAINALGNIGIGNTQVLVNAAVTSATVTFQNALAATPVQPITSSSSLTGGTNPNMSVTNTTSGFLGLSGGTNVLGSPSSAITAGHPTTGQAASGGLTGGTNQLVTVSLTTAGFGLTGTAPAPATSTVTVGGQGGLSGGTSQAVQAVTISAGFGLNGGIAPTTLAYVAGGQGGLSGGTSQAVAVATTVTGFGLTGTNPTVTPATTNPSFGGDLVVSSVISGTGTASTALVKSGPGILTFAGTAANNYNSQTVVDGGMLLLDMQASVPAYSGTLIVNGFLAPATVKVISNFNNQLNIAAVVVNGTTGTLDLSGSSSATNQTIASLDIRGGTVKTGSSTLNLAGTLTGLPGIATSGAEQTSTVTGILALAGTQTFAAADVSGVPGLTVTATIAGVNFGINKAGTGTVVLNNTVANTYSGTTTVNEGTLTLSASAIAVPGNLMIGDSQGGSGSVKADLVQMTTASDISSSAALTVNDSGQLNLNNNAQTIASLTITGGTVTTGTGTLTLGGNVAGVANPTNQTPAIISGNLALGSGGTAVTRIFDVQQGTLNGPDMIVNAVISNGTTSASGLTKVNNTGTLQFLLNNIYTGATTVSAGTLLVDGSQTGSAVTVSGGTLGGKGSTGAVTVTTGGVVNPGDPVASAGTLTINSPVGTAATADFSGGGNLTLEIGGFSNATTQTYDQLNLAGLGVLKLGGTSLLTLDLAGLTGDGTANAVIQYSGVIGNFASVTTIDNPLNLSPQLNFTANALNITFSGPATHFVFSGAVNATAGVPFTVTVTALDQFNNPALSYTGTVHFTTSDPAARPPVVLPADYTFVPGTAGDGGIHVFSGVILATVGSGSQTLTATDAANGISGSAVIGLVANSATHLGVAATGNVAAGNLFVFTVTALDAFNNIATSYSGTLHFTSTDGQAELPFNTALPGGTGFFAASLRTAGNQTIAATDTASAAITGTSNTVVVGAGALNHFGIIAPATSTANNPLTITVKAQDQFNNTVTNYGGTVHFASSDASASLPADTTLASGIGTLSLTLRTAGSQTLSATDTLTGSITGTTIVAVSASTVHSFTVSIPSSAAAGSSFFLAVTARDQFGNTVTGYTGTVHFSSTDPQAGLPADSTLTAGVGFFGASLRTAGNQTITASDTASSTITGSATISVTGLAASRFAVSATPNAVTGNPESFTVKAQDQFGNPVSGYSGTVHFTSSDPSAVLPGNSTLTGGIGTFSATLKTPGIQTITASDVATPTIAGTSNNIATLGLVVTSFTVTSTGFVAFFDKPFDPTQINLYDAAGTYGPDDVLLAGGPGTFQTSIRGSLIIDPTDTTITFVKTSVFTNPVNSFNPQTGVLAAGTYTVTFRSASNGFKDLLGAPLDGTASGNPAGSNYVTTFVVATTPAVVVGVPGFARGPGNTVNLPNNASGVGIPVSISDGTGLTSGKFTLQYNTALLTITGATVNSALTGSTLTLDAASTPGNAVIDFSSTTAIAPGPARLGGLVATVPNSAGLMYKSKALLHFSSVLVNGAAATGDDAVDVDAYFGDTNGDGQLSGGDASDISRVASGVDNNAATGVIGGFAAYPLADPVLIGDLSGSGSVSAASVTLMNSFLAGTPRSQIPALPTGLTIVTTGPDPSLSLAPLPSLPPGGGRVGWGPGNTIIVPVNIDTARPAGSTGMTEAILAVKYDPREFTVTAADVALGTLPLSPLAGRGVGGEGNGWQLDVAINATTGEIGIDLFGSTPIQTTSAGSLVTIAFQVRQDAPAGATRLSLVSSVDPIGQRAFQTTVSDAQGALTLHPALTALGSQPGTGAQITVTNPAVVGQVGGLPLAAIPDPVIAANAAASKSQPLPIITNIEPPNLVGIEAAMIELTRPDREAADHDLPLVDCSAAAPASQFAIPNPQPPIPLGFVLGDQSTNGSDAAAIDLLFGSPDLDWLTVLL